MVICVVLESYTPVESGCYTAGEISVEQEGTYGSSI